jgi:jouberin
LRPEKKSDAKTGKGNQAYGGQSVFDYVHPNCMVFNSNGRLFVGDSRGHISVWDITLKNSQLQADNFFQIRQKELEGDAINQLIVHPEHENKLFVHSRDNCIRLLEYESMKGPRVRMRFFGSKCTNLMVRSCVSPDGQFMVAGSEDGVPHIWDIISGEEYGPKITRNYECRFLDLVSDISWNPKYNMFALSGFGHSFPVMVYVYERSEEQLNEILY